MHMAQNPKKTGSDLSADFRRLHNVHGKSKIPKLVVMLTNTRMLISFLSALLQVVTGMALIFITILGIIHPLWISALLSILGSIACMTGVFLLYYTFAAEHNMESLINQAIKRVIHSQN